MRISEVTRRDITDAIRVEGVSWSGRLEEPQFLSRIFDLKNMPSTDGRFRDAFGDIWQHRINNYDWEDDWIFHDSRFDLLHCDDEIFLRFLCEMLHPVVRTDLEEVEKLRQLFNTCLEKDGFEIIERAKISGRPVFIARQRLSVGIPPMKSLRATFERADATYIVQQITRMEAAVEDDPDLAIGTAKELIETCCRTILDERGSPVAKGEDLPGLVKQTCKVLALTPEDIPEKAKAVDVIKRLLSNMATITQGIAELRNYYGTGHGKAAKTKGLQARHAKLAVGAASTLALFLLETHKIREKA